MRSERHSERHASNDSIDALIDDAARQLVAGEPSSSLRNAVRDRLGSRRWPWSFVPVMAAASAVLVLIAILVGRTVSDPTGTSAPSMASRAHDAAPARERIATAVEPANDAARDDTSSRVRRVRLQVDRVQPTRRLADEIAAPTIEEEALIPPITIEPIESAQIAADVSSGVMPMEIEPLRIEPLLSE